VAVGADAALAAGSDVLYRESGSGVSGRCANGNSQVAAAIGCNERERQDGEHLRYRGQRPWSGIPFVALRFSNILGPADYPEFPSFWPEPRRRKWNLWGYIDERDAAAACRLALDAPVEGSASFIIAAADTVMTRPSADLMREVFPGVPLTGEISETGTLLSIGRARQALGFEPSHSWRDHIGQ